MIAWTCNHQRFKERSDCAKRQFQNWFGRQSHATTMHFSQNHKRDGGIIDYHDPKDNQRLLG
jgi:hypothetical protein